MHPHSSDFSSKLSSEDDSQEGPSVRCRGPFLLCYSRGHSLTSYLTSLAATCVGAPVLLDYFAVLLLHHSIALLSHYLTTRGGLPYSKQYEQQGRA